MSRDYKNRIPAYRQQEERRAPVPRAAVAAALVSLVAAGAAGTYWLMRPAPEAVPAAPGTETRTAPAPLPETPATPKDAAAKAQAKKAPGKPEGTEQKADSHYEPRFTFYKVLPEKEIIIPENEIRTLKREESLGKNTEPTQYLIQAGSFTKQQDAEQLKARLAAIKVKAKLEMIKIDQASWYRIKIGPYANLSDADRVRQYLRTHNIDSVVQRAAKTKP